MSEQLSVALSLIDETLSGMRVADIQGAANFGMDSVFTNHIEDTSAHLATYEVRHLKELEDIF